MNNGIPDWLIEIGHKYSKNELARFVFKPVYDKYREYMRLKTNRKFHKNALAMLKSFDICMNREGIPYSLAFGSLLGAVREKGFIKHDLDVDVAIPVKYRNEKLHDILRSNRFDLIYEFKVGDGTMGCEETYEFDNTGVTLDIFYICPPVEEYPYCCLWGKADGCATYRESMRKIGGIYVKRVEQPMKEETIRVPFENIMVSITTSANICLEFAYGKDYMIPNPNYVPTGEHRILWEGKLGTFKAFKK